MIGAAIYLMELVEGRTFWNSILPELSKAERRACYEAMIDTAAALHSIDHKAVGLGDLDRPGNYLQRQVTRWTKQYHASNRRHLRGREADRMAAPYLA